VHPIESYLAKLAEIRASGHATDETSFYPAIEELLSEIGNRMKPRVKPVLQLKNRGAGLPDGGLFTQDQLKKSALPEDFTVQPPNRGVVEVKGLAEETGKTVQSEQVKKYLRAYGQVLLTNYREFRVVVLGKDDKPRTLEDLHTGQERNRILGAGRSSAQGGGRSRQDAGGVSHPRPAQRRAHHLARCAGQLPCLLRPRGAGQDRAALFAQGTGRRAQGAGRGARPQV
jgi:hypothetical protein